MKQDKLKTGILVASLITVLFFSWFFFHFTMDDAYISYRYSENLINGGGLTWNAGEDPVEGYSNFLWIIIAAVVMKIGIPVVSGMKFFGIILALLNLGLIYKIAYQITKNELWSSVAVIFTALTPAWGFWAVGGLENHLFMFFLYLGIFLLFNQFKERTQPYFAIPFAFAAMTRHEGAVIYVATLFFLLLAYTKFKPSIKKDDAIYWCKAALLFGIIYTPYFIWRVQYYGYFFPNTYYIKVVSGAGWPEIKNFLKYF